jgi:hypothetical protein
VRDNDNNWRIRGVAAGVAQIRPVSFIRTENQLRPFDGFKPEEVSPRSAPSPTAGDGYTLQLAHPPGWTHRDDLPCTKLVPRGNAGDPFDTNNKRVARALCAGCPVQKACLDEAMEAEGERPAKWRWLVRGGLTPKERAARARRSSP